MTLFFASTIACLLNVAFSLCPPPVANPNPVSPAPTTADGIEIAIPNFQNDNVYLNGIAKIEYKKYTGHTGHGSGTLIKGPPGTSKHLVLTASHVVWDKGLAKDDCGKIDKSKPAQPRYMADDTGYNVSFGVPR